MLTTINCPLCGMPLRGTVNHDPGVHTFSNGDPGYPPSTEVDWDVTCGCGYWNSTVDSEHWAEQILDALLIAKKAQTLAAKIHELIEHEIDANPLPLYLMDQDTFGHEKSVDKWAMKWQCDVERLNKLVAQFNEVA